MKSVNWGQAMTVGANLGVLAGLLLVAVQINQHSASVRNAAYQEWVAANMELNMATADPYLATAVARGTGRSADIPDNDSYLAFAMWHQSFYQMAQTTNYLYEQGDLDEELWEVEMDRAAVHLGLPGVREWWDAGPRVGRIGEGSAERLVEQMGQCMYFGSLARTDIDNHLALVVHQVFGDLLDQYA